MFKNPTFAGLAKVHFGPSDYMLQEPGAYVLCAITGEKIKLDRLRYWSHERQEAYVDAAASLEAWKKANA